MALRFISKEKFDKMEKVCKKSWKAIAKQSMDCKPNHLNIYKNYCPACDLASVMEKDGHIRQWCQLCPIDDWRKEAIRQKAKIGESICEQPEEAYMVWLESKDVNEKNKAALEISEMKWSYLPEYLEKKESEE